MKRLLLLIMLLTSPVSAQNLAPGPIFPPGMRWMDRGKGGITLKTIPRVKLTIALDDRVGSQQLKRSLADSWIDRYHENRKKQGLDPISLDDEDGCAILHQVNEIEYRRLACNQMFEFEFVDVQSIRTTVVDDLCLAPAIRIGNNEWVEITPEQISHNDHYKLIEWMYDEYWLYNLKHLAEWREEKIRIDNLWESMERSRRFWFANDYINSRWEVGETEHIWLCDCNELMDNKGNHISLESIGYKPAPPPKYPAKPLRKPCPVPLR